MTDKNFTLISKLIKKQPSTHELGLESIKSYKNSRLYQDTPLGKSEVIMTVEKGRVPKIHMDYQRYLYLTRGKTSSVSLKPIVGRKGAIR